MRAVVALLLVLAAGLIALLVWSRETGPRREPARDSAMPARPAAAGDRPGAVGPAPAGAPRVERLLERARARDPDLQAALAGFVKRTRQLGAAAVPGLLAFLRAGDDAATGVVWELRDGRLLGGYPSVRAAAIAALVGIPGPEATDALKRLYERLPGLGETYLVAAELHRRGQAGFEPRLIELIETETAGGDEERVQGKLAELAAGIAPAAVALRIEERAPRGKERRAPGALSRALETLPWQHAERTARRLLEDPGVTSKAKARYLARLLARPEPGSVRLVRDAWSAKALPRALRDNVVEALAEGGRREAARYDRVRDEEAAAIRQRFTARLAEAEELVRTLYGDEGEDPADKARRALTELRALSTRLHPRPPR